MRFRGTDVYILSKLAPPIRTHSNDSFFHHYRTLISSFLFVFQAFPKVMLSHSTPIVGAYPGDKLWCSAIGFQPIYLALTGNSTVLTNTTNTVEILLFKGGNYSCVATNTFGVEEVVIPVSVIGDTSFHYHNIVVFQLFQDCSLLEEFSWWNLCGR